MVVLQNRLVTCGHHESLLQCKYNYCTNLYQNLKDNKHKGVNEKEEVAIYSLLSINSSINHNNSIQQCLLYFVLNEEMCLDSICLLYQHVTQITRNFVFQYNEDYYYYNSTIPMWFLYCSLLTWQKRFIYWPIVALKLILNVLMFED